METSHKTKSALLVLSSLITIFLAGISPVYAQTAPWNIGADASDSSKLKFIYQDQNPALTITPDGLLGIGTTNPVDSLDIRGGLRVSGNDKSISGEAVIRPDNLDSVHSATGESGSQNHFRLSTAKPISPGVQDFLITPYTYGMSVQWLGTLEFWVQDVSFRGFGPDGAHQGSVWVDDRPDTGGWHFTTNTNPNQAIATAERFDSLSHGSMIFRIRDKADSFLFQSGAKGAENTKLSISANGDLSMNNNSVYAQKDTLGRPIGLIKLASDNTVNIGALGQPASNGHLIFYANGSEKMRITPDGNVGIGTPNPGSDKLDVRGRAYASGGWQTTDADYAEWFEKEEDAVPGDIIGIDLQTGKARKYHAGDKFIGIYSTNPAVVGNRSQETEEQMQQSSLLVGLLGQLDFDKSQTIITGRLVQTLDGKNIGILLSNNKVLIGK